MANKTVVFNNQVYAGTAGLTLLLISPTDGSIGNGAGDTLTAGISWGFFFTHEANIMVQVLPSRLDDGPNIPPTRRGAGGLHPIVLRLLERRMRDVNRTRRTGSRWAS